MHSVHRGQALSCSREEEDGADSALGSGPPEGPVVWASDCTCA